MTTDCGYWSFSTGRALNKALRLFAAEVAPRDVERQEEIRALILDWLYCYEAKDYGLRADHNSSHWVFCDDEKLRNSLIDWSVRTGLQEQMTYKQAGQRAQMVESFLLSASAEDQWLRIAGRRAHSQERKDATQH